MIVNHTTGERVSLPRLLALFPSIAAADNPLIGTNGIRGPWSSPPTDAELRTVGYSYVVETEQPTPGEGEQVRAGPIELIDDAWRRTWIVEPVLVYVPESVPGHQMRAVLRTRVYDGVSLWDTVVARIQQFPEPQRTILDDSMRTAGTMRRDSVSIAGLASLMQLDSDYIDGLFIEADGWKL